jgi:alkylation response protein AidB-like acyl-CoA dehydrogenase
MMHNRASRHSGNDRMSDLEAFRADTRQWLEANYPKGLAQVSLEDDGDGSIWGGRRAKFKNKDAKLWLDRMAEKGWTAPTWPKDYGGGGLSACCSRSSAASKRGPR